MSSTHHCPECGAALAADAPSGLCPECLLKQGFDTRQPAEAEPFTAPRPGGFVAPSVQEVAKQFPHLEILELLGQGGMGAVYKARQPTLDRFVALKILPPEFAKDPAFAERFTREARALARLNHPQIVAVYDFGRAGDFYYFLMELVDGLDLRRMLAAGRLEPKEALAIVPQICEALQYAHDEGIVHRDIKPQNILIDKRGRVKIADFGLAKLLRPGEVDVSLTGTHQVMGTLRYMAPEQMEGSRAVDHRADIYSLGVVFYELLTGEVPMGRFAPPSQKVQIDVRLDEVVLRSLEKEPDRRYQQASQVKSDVESISLSMPVSGSPRLPESHPAAADLEFARYLVRGPSVALLIAGLVPVVAAFLLLLSLPLGFSWLEGLGQYLRNEGLADHYLAYLRHGADHVDFVPVNVLVATIYLVYGGLLTCGGWLIRRLRAFEFVVLSAVLAVLPLLMCLFGLYDEPMLPFLVVLAPASLAGVSALASLVKPEVRVAFKVRLRQRLGEVSGSGRGRANRDTRRIVSTTAEGLFLWAAISLLTGIGAFVWLLLVEVADERVWRDLALMGSAHLLFSPLIGLTGILLRRLRWWPLVLLLVAALGAPALFALQLMIDFGPFPGWHVLIPFWLGLPLAIWTIRLLFRQDVKAAFEENRQSRKEAPATPTEPTASASRPRADPNAQAYVKAPASLLIVFANLNVVALLALFIKVVDLAASKGADDTGIVAVAVALGVLVAVNIPLSGVMWLGGARLWDLESPRLVRVATLLAMLPLHPGFPLGIPLGIWILSTLARPEVRRAFGGLASDSSQPEANCHGNDSQAALTTPSKQA